MLSDDGATDRTDRQKEQTDRQNRETATEIGAEAGNEVTATAADCPQSEDRERERRYRCICTIVPLRYVLWLEKVDLHCRFKEKDCVQLLERLPSPPALFANSISDLFMGRFSELSATVECPLPIPHMTNYICAAGENVGQTFNS